MLGGAQRVIADGHRGLANSVRRHLREAPRQRSARVATPTRWRSRARSWVWVGFHARRTQHFLRPDPAVGEPDQLTMVPHYAQVQPSEEQFHLAGARHSRFAVSAD